MLLEASLCLLAQDLENEPLDQTAIPAGSGPIREWQPGRDRFLSCADPGDLLLSCLIQQGLQNHWDQLDVLMAIHVNALMTCEFAKTTQLLLDGLMNLRLESLSQRWPE